MVPFPSTCANVDAVQGEFPPLRTPLYAINGHEFRIATFKMEQRSAVTYSGEIRIDIRSIHLAPRKSLQSEIQQMSGMSRSKALRVTYRLIRM